MKEKFIKLVEATFIRLDTSPWNAVFRVAIGLILPLVPRALFGAYPPVWVLPVFFVALLVALRLIPAVLRLVLPFSAEAKAIWAQRRALAKQYDSYQWQKLFWIGLGLLSHVLLAGAAQTGDLAVAMFCLIGGGLGLLMWRKASPSP